MKLRCLIKRREKNSSLYHVYIAMYQGDATQLFSIGERISKQHWSVKDNLPKDHSGDVFKAIEKVKSQIQKVVRRLEAAERHVTPYTVKEAYKDLLAQKAETMALADKQTKAESITVARLATRWSENETFRFRKSTQKSVTESINAFISYLSYAGLASLERRGLTQITISGYERYLLEQKKLSDNTHGKRMKHLRWFLKTLDLDVSKIKLRSSKKTIISLTLEELVKLERLEISGSIEQQKAKDLFLLGCYTGLRVSDLKRLNPTNTRDGFIAMKLLKNNKDVRIPIIGDAERILIKYERRAPKLSEQALNDSLKIICKDAGITSKINIDTTRAGQRVTKVVPKYEVITSHIAGKTFISLAPKKWGLSPAEISSLVGKDLKTLIGSYFNDQGEEARSKMISLDTSKI